MMKNMDEESLWSMVFNSVLTDSPNEKWVRRIHQGCGVIFFTNTPFMDVG